MQNCRSCRERTNRREPRVIVRSGAVVGLFGLVVASAVLGMASISLAQSSSTDAAGGSSGKSPVLLTRAEVEKLYLAAGATFTAALEHAGKEPDAARTMFAEAAALYDAAADGGAIRNTDLDTNIGNARLLAGDSARAIGAFRRALALEPGHEGAARGLAAARRAAGTESLAPRSIIPGSFLYPTAPTSPGPVAAASPTQSRFSPRALFAAGADALERVNARVRPGTLRAVAIFTYTLAFAAAIARTVGVHRVPRWAPAAVLGVSFLIASPLMIRAWRAWDVVDAVVVGADIVARQGPAELYDPAFKEPLRPGLEVRIREVRGDWARVLIADSREAWMRTSGIEPIR